MKFQHATNIKDLIQLFDGQKYEIRPKLSVSSLGRPNIPREIVVLIETENSAIIAEFSGDAMTDRSGVSLDVKNTAWDEILIKGGEYKVAGFYADKKSRIEENAYILIFAGFFYNDENPEVEGEVAQELYEKAWGMYLEDSPELDEIAQAYDFEDFDNFLEFFEALKF